MVAAALLGILTGSTMLFIFGLMMFTIVPPIVAGIRRARDEPPDGGD
jgi:hypothetical protein